jgi:hypothetical protein
MKYGKKRIALIFSLILSMSVNVFAQDMEQQNEIGVGEIEGTVKENVYQVVLPTVTNEAFDFIIDPQGLINKTNGAAYSGATFSEASTLFFKRTDGKIEEDYSNKSDEVTITNMSSIAIKLSVNISMLESSLGGINMTDDESFIDDTSTSLYMALIDGKNVVPIGYEGASFEVEIEAAPEEAYEYSYDNQLDKYSYKLKDDISGIDFHKYTFQLTGAANGKGDWSKLDNVAPEINVSWKICSTE